MNPAFEANEDPDINGLWLWFEYQVQLVADSRANVLNSSRWAKQGQGRGLRDFELQFIGLSLEEVDEFFEMQKGQLDLLTMFELLATVEAVLRNDFRNRVTRRKKDGLSRRYRELNKKRPGKIRLDEDILAAMLAEGASGRAVANFRGALQLRHWLAHGRHWSPKLGRGYTPNDVFDISRALIDSFPAA